MIGALLALALPAAGFFWGGQGRMETPRRLFEQGKFEQVIGELSPAAISRMSSKEQRQAYLFLGEAHERLGRSDEALGVYQLGVRLFPKDINLLSQLATLLHRHGLEEQAEPVFQKVLSIHPNNAKAHLGLAQIDHSLGFYDRSAEHYEKALEQLAENHAVWREYAELLIAARDWPTAELAARRSLSIKEDVDARYALAVALRGAGKLSEAITTVLAAQAAAPGRLDLGVARGLWLLEAERYADAAAAADSLLKAPEPPLLAYWIRARVRLKRDEYGGAVDDLKRVAAADRQAPFASAAAKTLLAELGAR